MLKNSKKMILVSWIERKDKNNSTKEQKQITSAHECFFLLIHF